jgi:hypothetical protein
MKTKTKIKQLIEDFKEEIKDIKQGEKTARRNRDYAEASHNHSVRPALVYVVDRLKELL